MTLIPVENSARTRLAPRRLVLAICLVLGGLTTRLSADDTQYFREYVEPILQNHCYDCHSHAAGEASGGLVLDSKTGWSVGGDSGPAIVPGQPDKSLLIAAVRYENSHLQMPPDGKRTSEEIATLEKWVARGAVDPREGGVAAERKGIDWEAARQWWAFQPIEVPHDLNVDGSEAIDHFIESKLQENDLTMAPEADPAVLLRRLTYDLTGLPPTPDQMREFVRVYKRQAAKSASGQPPAIYTETVDQLLASPQFGAKWGRHWLDVARYADSNGSSFNPPFREAWRYRNWVIDAHNQDMPIDQFLKRQIAGDLLPAESQEERDAHLIATGYLMLGSKVLGTFDKEQLTLDVIDEQIDTVSKSMLGMTVACARCHDHKFDPIPQTDYYALAGIFSSTVTLDDRLGGPKEDESDWSRRGLGANGDEQLRAFLKEKRHQWVKADGNLFKARSKVKQLEQQLDSADAEKKSQLAENLEEALREFAEAEEKLRKMEADLPPFAMAVAESDQPADISLRIRGVAASRGEVVPRGFLQIAHFPSQPKINPDHSGRLELAHWIAHPDNPLTARVYVNRVWKHLFRSGIVASVDNFGITGDEPSHPQLLDYLATRFLSRDWQLKPLVREIVMTKAYRMSVRSSPSFDPENRLLSHQNRRRLAPEEIRDTLLMVGGKLDLSQGQGQIGHLPLGDVSNLGDALKVSDSRRTVYQPVIRTLEPEVLQLFDAANNSMTTGDRPKTIAAPQALYFMNSELVQESAALLAEQILAQKSDRSVPELVEEAFVRICCRPPTPREANVLAAYLERQFEGPPGPTRHDMTKLCQAILGSTQLQFVE